MAQTRIPKEQETIITLLLLSDFTFNINMSFISICLTKNIKLKIIDVQ